MPEDKSLFFYGSMYHRMIDPIFSSVRQIAADLIPEKSSILDIACGTGLFSIQMRAQKNCRVVGIDLSLKQIEFAQKSNRFQEVTFLHKDATNLNDFADHTFDYASIMYFIHEIPRAKELEVLREALRVAARVLIIDSAFPLPKNLGGMILRFVEGTIGRDHYHNFRAYLASGGIEGLLKEFAQPIRIEHRQVFFHNTRELLLLAK